MKLIDKDAALAEIGKRIIDAPINYIGHQRVWAYNDVKDILETLEVKELQEEPISKELEEASKEWLRPQLDKSYAAYGETKQMELTHFDGYAMLDAIEFGAKWKEQQMMTKAIVREVKVDAGGYPYIDTTELYDYDKDMPLANEGDKVKVIILNDE